MDPLAYCEDKLAHPDSDYPLVRVFLDTDTRQLHVALQALRLELLSIPDKVNDPGIAQTKLHWWREELLRFMNDEARHPVTQLLGNYRDKLAPESLLHMTLAIDALLQEGHTWETFEQLYTHCLTISGTPASLEAGALGLDNEAGALAGQIGAAAHLTRLIATLRADAIHNRLSLPIDELARFQVSRTELGAGAGEWTDSEAIAALVELQTSRAAALHTEALEALSPSQRYTLLPWTLRAQLDRVMLAQKPGVNLQFGLGPARRLWIAWRTAGLTKREALGPS